MLTDHAQAAHWCASRAADAGVRVRPAGNAAHEAGRPDRGDLADLRQQRGCSVRSGAPILPPHLLHNVEINTAHTTRWASTQLHVAEQPLAVQLNNTLPSQLQLTESCHVWVVLTKSFGLTFT
jgi:hypothetical protein